MRIGIITFHKAINYGSVLQTWATQNLLEKEGFEVDVIDYEPEHYGEIYDIYCEIQVAVSQSAKKHPTKGITTLF